MYFSLITPTPGAERSAALQWAKSPYGDHQWVWRFLAAEAGASRGFIFRRRDGENKMPGFYVVSAREPLAFTDDWQVESREYDPQLQQGQRFSFELRANPVVRHTVDGKSRRDDVVMQEKKRLLADRGLKRWADWPDKDESKPVLYELVHAACLQWLEKRADGAGFRLLVDEIHDDEGDRVVKRVRADGYTQHRAEKKDIQFSTVDFSGEIEITNPQAFRKTLFEGIGPAKAFGCGLLLVRRV